MGGKPRHGRGCGERLIRLGNKVRRKPLLDGMPLIRKLRGWLGRRLQLRRQVRLVLRSGLFDADWYLGRYPDVAAAGLDPVLHFLRHGAGEGRDPGPSFDARDYLARHPEASTPGQNPLLHYLSQAAANGGGPAPHPSPTWRRLFVRRRQRLEATDATLPRASVTPDAMCGWVLAYPSATRPGATARLHVQDAEGRFSEIVLRSGGVQLVHLPHRPARLTAQAVCGAVRLQEIAGGEATMRALFAGGWRQLPERLRARRRLGGAAWLAEQAARYQPVALDDYQNWALLYDTPSPGQLDRLAARASNLPQPPRFSVIVPVYDTDAAALCEMIASVRGQVYPHWQLCIADDASRAPHVRAILERAAREEPRIALAFRPENGHIAAASNSAIELARGEWLAMLDHDDVLPPQALATLALAIAANPGADLLYSDEDRLDALGRRYGAYFKPDFSPELLEAQNFLNHLTVYRTSAVRALGGLRVGFEGSQDYDLALRVTAATRHPVVHVPHVLYHWRVHPGAATFSSTQLERANVAARRALRDHAAARGETVEVVADHTHRVLYPPPRRWPRVTAIVPTRDHLDVLRVCIEGLLDGTDYPALDIIVVDNASERPDTLAWLDAIAARGVTVLRYPHPFNHSAMNNFAASQARGEILLLLNNDVAVIEPGWLREMVRLAMRPGIGAVGAKLLYHNDTVQHAGMVLGMGGVGEHVYRGAARDDPGYYGRLRTMQEVGCVTAACMAVPASAYAAVGGFDAEHLAVAFNDVDFCLRLRASGRRILWTPHALLHHWEARSRGSDFVPERLARFLAEIEYMKARWPAELARDPFFSPNFSDDRWPHYAAPPRVTPPWAVADDQP